MSPKRHLRSSAAIAMLSMVVGAGVATAQTNPTQTQASPAQTQPPSSYTSSQAAQTNSGDTASGTGPSRADRTFIRKAAEGNVAEVDLGRMAQQTSQDPNVRAFGERMVRDHTQANEQLTSVAQSLNVTLPTSPSKSDQAKIDKLSHLTGADFDEAFAREMVKEHRTDIRAFERETKDGRDSQVKQFAESTLPTIREHLAMAEKLPGAQGRTASAGASNQTQSR
jgi:putative membrane protein